MREYPARGSPHQGGREREVSAHPFNGHQNAGSVVSLRQEVRKWWRRGNFVGKREGVAASCSRGADGAAMPKRLSRVFRLGTLPGALYRAPSNLGPSVKLSNGRRSWERPKKLMDVYKLRTGHLARHCRSRPFSGT